MTKGLTKSQRRDLKFAAFIIVNLFCLGGFLFSDTETVSELTGGWRRIDLDALMAHIRAGKLVTKEAAWYRLISRSQTLFQCH